MAKRSSKPATKGDKEAPIPAKKQVDVALLGVTRVSSSHFLRLAVQSMINREYPGTRAASLQVASGKKDVALAIVNLASADEEVLKNSDFGVVAFSWNTEFQSHLIFEAIGPLNVPEINWILVGFDSQCKTPTKELVIGRAASVFEADLGEVSLRSGIGLHEVFETIARLWTKGAKSKH
jgi:hypothetical protein